MSLPIIADEVDDLVADEPPYSETLEEDLIKLEKISPKITPSPRAIISTRPKPLTKTELRLKKRKKEIEPWKASLKKGSLLLDLKSKKEVRMPDNLVVWATIDNDQSQIATIYDQELKPRYSTASQNLNSLERAYQIYPIDPPVNHQIKKVLARSVDKELRFDTSITYGWESYSHHYFNSLYDTNSQSSSAHNIGAQTYYSFSNIIDFGIAASFQVGSWQDTEGFESSWNSFFIGPSLRKTLFGDKNSNHLSLNATFLKSLFAKSKGDYGSQDFSSLGYELGLDYNFKLSSGELIFGLKYRYLDTTLNSSSINYAQSDSSTQTSSIGFNIGYQWGWDYL